MTGKAVVLVSGGLDSATVLAIAKKRGFDCYALSVAYGQRHSRELECAKLVSESLGATTHRVATLDCAFESSLTGRGAVPKGRSEAEMGDGIPSTYVPARNTILLGIALSWAEAIEARDIFVGVNSVDYSGYPDCRPEFISAFESLAQLATRSGVEGQRMIVHAPLVSLAKAEIIRSGVELGVDYSLTHSCYDPVGARACGRCDSCQLRLAGFAELGLKDPIEYV